MCMTAKSPGPGDYSLPPNIGYKNHDVRKRRSPQYSFGMRLNITGESVGPGPGAFLVGNVTHKGKFESPKFSMCSKRSFEVERRSPGPASTDVNLKPIFKGVRGPQYTLQSKHYPSDRVDSPAPNSYNIKKYLTSRKPPEYSIALAVNRTTFTRSPGPADYERTNVLLRKSPQYSIVGRKSYLPKKGDIGPAPYNCSKYKPGTKGIAYSFGLKHSPYIVIPCDN